MLKKCAVACAMMLCGSVIPDQSEDGVSVVEGPPTTKRNEFYLSNRDPLQPNPLIKLPIRAIEPHGWLRKMLELEAAGFTGHLAEISRFLRKEDNAWINPKAGPHGWEEVPYWLKGYANLAFVLRNEVLLEEAKTWIEQAIKSQQPDGWFGPESNRTRLDGNPDLWPNMIMLFCLQDYYDYTGDERVLQLMVKYFKHLSGIPAEQFLPDYWDKIRAGDQLYSILWLYNRTGETWLLDLARKTHRNAARWDEDVINWHNVNIAQAFGEPTTYWILSKRPDDLKASYRNYDKVRGTYGQVPGGMFGADENARPGRTDPRQAVETCGMVEMMLSCETLTWITGDPLWADRCEDVAFNSLPAALSADLKALRYLTAPNMAVSDRKDKSPGVQNGGPMFHMNPHDHRCCQHNWGHAWPYYAQHLWFATPDDGLAAVLYSASRVSATVSGAETVTIEERTRYPFGEQVTFTVSTSRPARFPLYLRVPGWCSGAAVSVDGERSPVKGSAGRYIRIARLWRNGDTVRLDLPMMIALRRWEENHNSVSVDRGPLTYSLRIGEKYVRSGGSGKWPAWEILPTTPWNYGLVLDETNPAGSFQVVKRDWPSNDMPFTHEGTPIEIRAKGKRIPQWQLDKHGLVAELQDSPVKSDQPVETITLIPMGAARLRISAFPVTGEGADAQTWIEPERSD